MGAPKLRQVLRLRLLLGQTFTGANVYWGKRLLGQTFAARGCLAAALLRSCTAAEQSDASHCHTFSLIFAAELSPRPTWPADAAAEEAKSSVMNVRMELEMQSRASNQLLWAMENKLASEEVMMDEIDVLMQVLRDNLTPSLVTTETQVRGQGFGCLVNVWRIAMSL